MSTPIGPYTPVVAAGPWLITSGQIGLEPGTDPPALAAGGAVAQLVQALTNGERLLGSAGASLTDVVKTTVFATDAADFPVVNEAYVAAFAGHRPARSMVAVSALPMGADVEIELWAHLDPS